MGPAADTATAPTWLDALRPALERLDARLQTEQGRSPHAVAERGHSVEQPLFTDNELPPFLQWLAASYDLASFDLDLLLLALTPEIDPQYEARFAAFQADPSGQPGPTRPTAGTALRLLCGGPHGEVAGRERLEPDAPLVAHGLLRRLPDIRQSGRPELADQLVVDEAVAGVLTGQLGLPARLAACGSLLLPRPWPAWLPAADPRRRGLTTLLSSQARRGASAGRRAVVVLEGPPGSGKQAVAQALAGEAGLPLILLDLERASELGERLPELTALAGRTARFRNLILLVDGLEAIRESARGSVVRGVLAALSAHPGRVILTGERPWPRSADDPPGLTIVSLGVPPFDGRRACWLAALAAARVSLAPTELDQLASRFRLTPGQVTAAVRTAQANAHWRAACTMRPGEAARPSRAIRSARTRRSEPAEQPTLPDLLAAARAHSSHGLASVARQIGPRYGWDDIILPPDQRAQLREIAAAVSLRHVVQERWGFGARLSGGKGLNVLFAGPSGTGKTMAAEVLAHELGLDLYAIDLSRVVSKYIGETEKNLDRVFTEAEASNAILFFDEADALFGKRSEVKDAHDRYANIETGYLLQKMEEYEGVAILATNLRANLDEAFARRMHALVEFPFPDEALRARIWQVVFPPDVPLGPDVDAGQLARAFKLSGGNIRNVALTAAYLAAEDGPPVSMRHLTRAARREYQKLGRAWDEPALAVAGRAR